MKKFCNKIPTPQWRVSVPNLNTNIFRKSLLSGDVETDKKRVSSGSYDLPAAQREYDQHGRVSSASHSLPPHSDTSSTGSYQDACQENETTEIYDVVEVPKNIQIIESSNMTECNSRYEYDVPKIHFCFIEQQKHNRNISEGEVEKYIEKVEEVAEEDDVKEESPKYENQAEIPKLSKGKHRSQLQIFVTNIIELDAQVTGSPVIKFGSDPNLKLTNDDDDHDHEHDSDGSDAFYKVPRRYQMTSNEQRLSKSLHDFNMDELDLPQLSLSVESIEHISCSQVLPKMSDDEHFPSGHPAAKSAPKSPQRRWENFKSKFDRFNRSLEDQAANQRVGAFQNQNQTQEKYAKNLEVMYKNSKDKCKRIINKTGRMFKRHSDVSTGDGKANMSDNSSQIVKNDAFFAKITASDIEYVLPKLEDKKDDVNIDASETDADVTITESCPESEDRDKSKDKEFESVKEVETKRKNKMSAIAEEVRNNFRKSRLPVEGQNGFDDLRRYVKQGGDFAKELATILQERSDAELQYSKSLSKLSTKLSRSCREGVGGLNEAWKAVAIEMETRAEAHRHMSNVLLEETAKPLKILSENQHRQRKNSEAMVDKAAKVLSEWRVAEGKSKKHSHACARDNEKLQDAMLENRMARSTSLIQLPNIHKNTTEKDNAKLEGKKRKAEDAVKKADIDYYSHCVRSERSRLEWESAVLKGATTFQTLEEDRLNSLKATLACYLKHNAELSPKLEEAIVKIRVPIEIADAQKDLSVFVNLRQSSQQTSEQLLPDFYCEHITLAMNRERRKQALVKLLQLIKLDIERERKAKTGLENLSKAIKQTPNFGAEDSQQTVAEKLYHMKSMLTYLEGAKYKVQSALAELDCRPRTGHPLASHITVTRDKAGLQQSILKAPVWLREQWTPQNEMSNEKNHHETPNPSPQHSPQHTDVENNWVDRGMADGNSNQHDSDFDEFSSQGSSICGGNCHNETHEHIDNVDNVQPIAECKALYLYTPNLPDELAIRPGDKVVVYRQQEDGWWLGECNGAVGIFPATYVETIKA